MQGDMNGQPLEEKSKGQKQVTDLWEIYSQTTLQP